jgi:hypothetical protein
MELVDHVGVGDGEEVEVGVFSPFVADRVQPLDKQHAIGIDGADRGGDPGGQLDPLLLRVGDHRLIEQIQTGDGRLATVALGERRPELDEPILQVGAVPQRLAVPVRLKAARGHVHVEDQVDAVLLGPGDVVVQPFPAVGQVRAGRAVGLERPVVHVEAHGVQTHVGHPAVVLRIVVHPRQANVRPDVVAERYGAQHDRVAGVVDDPVPLHTEHAAPCRARRPDQSDAGGRYPGEKAEESSHR